MDLNFFFARDESYKKKIGAAASFAPVLCYKE